MRKIRVFSGPENSLFTSRSITGRRKATSTASPATTRRKARCSRKSCTAKLGIGKDSTIVSEFAGKRIVREPVPIKRDEPLKLELQHFVECVKAQQTPLVSGESAKRALDVAFEITRQVNESLAKAGKPDGKL